jgi:hypothetical protein
MKIEFVLLEPLDKVNNFFEKIVGSKFYLQIIANFDLRSDQMASANFDLRSDQMALANFDLRSNQMASANFDLRSDQMASANFDLRSDQMASANFDLRSDQMASANFIWYNKIALANFDLRSDQMGNFVRYEKNPEIFDTNRNNYSCFARAYKQSVLGAGDYILADKCIYMFCNCDKDHSTDCIEYIFPSNILDKTISRTLYSGKALTSFAKKVRSGVYRFDFLPTNCDQISNHYIFIKDFPTERESGCIVDLHWRTFLQEIHKDGFTFLVHFRNQISYN